MTATTSKIHENNNGGFKPSLKFGVYNCFLVHFSCYCLHHIIENYTTYGIIKGPLEITLDCFEFVQVHFWIYFILFLGTLIQIFAVFITEKLLALNYLSENIGLTWQGCNIFSMIVTSTALFAITKFNPVAAHLCTGYLACIFFKLFSYVSENKRSRNQYRRKKLDRTYDNLSNNHNEANYEIALYPNNVQFKDLFKFVACTGDFLYNPNGLVKTERNLKKAFRAICFGILLHYVCAFMIYQYVLPELQLIKVHFNTGQYLQLIGRFFKTLVPINIVWLLHYNYWCLTYFLPIRGWLFGYENSIYNLDWWNAENKNQYWNKWNFQMHLIFKKYFFIPLFKRGYSKRSASLAVAFTTGLLHEYLTSVPMRGSYGLAFAAMYLQIPFSIITTAITKKFGAQIGNMVVIVLLSLSFSSSTCVLYYNFTYE